MMDSSAPETPDAPPHGDAPEADIAEAMSLVLRAYAVARASGRQDWRRMTTAVLKNRLLDLTDREFDEAKWGATTTREFVDMLTGMLTLDFSTRPTTVVLRDEIDVDEQAMVAAAEPARKRGDWRVRPDLWDAIVDCVSGHVYVWDGSRAVAHSADELDETKMPVLPTATPEDLTQWREAFADGVVPDVSDALKQEIDFWRQSPLSSEMLPQRYRNRWYGVLKRHVRARLDEWFAERGIEPPHDWIMSATPVRTAPRDDTEHLRNIALRAVGIMTRAELDRLELPASVVARLLR